MKKVIIFDVDGTLLNTTEFIVQAFEHVLKKNGITAAREAIKKVIGKPLAECYEILGSLSADKAQTFSDAHRAFQKENVHLSTPFPGARDTLRTLKNAGYILVACTTRSKITSIDTLQKAELHEYLQVVISSEDSEKLKPHPDPLLEALKRVEAEAMHAVMVGDSHVDIQAGIAAGTKTIRCLYGVNQERLHDPEPDAFVGSISEVTPLVSKLF